MFSETMDSDVLCLNDPTTPNDKFLYHYTPFNTAFEYILHSGNLRLGSLLKTNDPRESKEWQWTFLDIPADSVEELQEQIKRSGYLASRIKKGCKLCCFSTDDKSMPPLSGRGWALPRMWAQYAEGHRGMCLVFEKSRLIEAAKRKLSSKGDLYFESVEYVSGNNLLNSNAFSIDYHKKEKASIDSTIDELVKKNYKYYFFTKNLDWQQEKEFRILLRGNDDIPEFIPIGSALVSIIAGIDFPRHAYEPLIRFYCQKYSAQFGYMNWYNGMPELVNYTYDD